MTSREAREVLLLYRPGTADAQDPQVAEALRLVPTDPDLKTWFEKHCAVQTALRMKFREVPVPPDLRQRILADRKTIRPAAGWRNPAWLAAAAAIVLFLGLAAWLMTLVSPRVPDQFADYRSRMVSAALRRYHMDLVTNDMSQVRQFMAKRGAPADYVVPEGLERLPLTGGGLLRWRNHPVSMVCFNRGDEEMLFLFVMDRSAVEDPPPSAPEVAKIKKLVTVSWTQNGKTYLLAGPEEANFKEKYL